MQMMMSGDFERQRKQEEEKRRREQAEQQRLYMAFLQEERLRAYRQALEREQLIKSHYDGLMDRMKQVNIAELRERSSDLIRLGQELRHIEGALQYCISDVQQYFDRAQVIINEGRDQLVAILDELRNSDVLPYLEEIVRDKRGALPTYDLGLLQEWETRFLESLGIDSETHHVLSEVFDAYREDRTISLDRLLGEAVNKFAALTTPSSAQDQLSQDIIRRRVHSGFKIFTGIGIGTVNVLAVWATLGLMLTPQEGLLSWATGASMAMDGVRLLREKPR